MRNDTLSMLVFFFLFFKLRVIIILHPLSDIVFCSFELVKRVFRNYDPSIRSQEKAVEYVRAVNAAKLDKVTLFCLGE